MWCLVAAYFSIMKTSFTSKLTLSLCLFYRKLMQFIFTILFYRSGHKNTIQFRTLSRGSKLQSMERCYEDGGSSSRRSSYRVPQKSMHHLLISLFLTVIMFGIFERKKNDRFPNRFKIVTTIMFTWFHKFPISRILYSIRMCLDCLIVVVYQAHDVFSRILYSTIFFHQIYLFTFWGLFTR